jgi:hypothetical protein
MDLTPLIPIVAIAAFAAIRLAKIKAGHSESMPADANVRIDALKGGVAADPESRRLGVSVATRPGWPCR